MIATSLVALAVAGTASAAPTLSFTWSATTGSGTTGGSSIDALPGDILTMDMVATGDSLGLTFAGVSLTWDAGDLVGGAALECPSPPNPFGPGVCTPDAAPAFPTASPLAPGVTVSPGLATSFDAAVAPPGSFPGGTSMLFGRITFTVGGSATTELVNSFYSPGLDSVNDGAFSVFFPAASATVIVPEPGTAGLMGLGLLALGMVGRRRN